MSDYFDHVERGLRETVRRRGHLPWYERMLRARSRPIVVAVVVLVGGGSALAAGVLRTGAPVGAQVPAIATAYEGAVIPASVRLLPLRVPDPDGGPPWGLRVLKTTRGLMCVQPGRVVDGQLGVLGQDGAFADDGAFHPFSSSFLGRDGCGTEDARGDAFVNERIYGLPASALAEDPRHTDGGCYGSRPRRSACPLSAVRGIYFGLLGPDASSITYTTGSGASATVPTAGSDGAYLIVLPERDACSAVVTQASRVLRDCDRTGTLIAGPDLRESEAMRTVSYRDGRTCSPENETERAERVARFRRLVRTMLPGIYRLLYPGGDGGPGALGALTPRQLSLVRGLQRRNRRETGADSGCPAIGYVPLADSQPRLTAARLASTVTVRAEPARYYCEKGENTVPCDGAIPRGDRRIDMERGPRELLLVVEFTARAAVSNFDCHYEINATNPSDPRNRQCPPAGGRDVRPNPTQHTSR